MSRKLFNVRNDERSSFSPAGSTDSFSFADPCASNRSLKRTKDQLLLLNKVETGPQPVELLLQGRSYIPEVGDQVRLGCQQTSDLRQQRFVLFFFGARG